MGEQMIALGFSLLVLGILLAVAETHVPGGTLGVIAGLALVAGGVTAILSVGGPVALAVPVGIGLGGVAGGWTLMIARDVVHSPRRRIRTGPEGLFGRVAVVRRWSDTSGQVFLDGTLWRACAEPLDGGASALHTDDRVVVESVSGLTLSVRPAEEWELAP